MQNNTKVVSYRHYMEEDLFPLLEKAKQLTGDTQAVIINNLLRQHLPTLIEFARTEEEKSIGITDHKP